MTRKITGEVDAYLGEESYVKGCSGRGFETKLFKRQSVIKYDTKIS